MRSPTTSGEAVNLDSEAGRSGRAKPWEIYKYLPGIIVLSMKRGCQIKDPEPDHGIHQRKEIYSISGAFCEARTEILRSCRDAKPGAVECVKGSGWHPGSGMVYSIHQEETGGFMGKIQQGILERIARFRGVENQYNFLSKRYN